MLIHEIAKEIGVQSKAVLNYLQKQGCDYKSTSKGITPEEERLVRSYFATPENLQAAASGTIAGAEKKDEDNAEKKKSVTTIIRSRGERRSFVPEDKRDDIPTVNEEAEVSASANETVEPEIEKSETSEKEHQPTEPVKEETVIEKKAEENEKEVSTGENNDVSTVETVKETLKEEVVSSEIKHEKHSAEKSHVKNIDDDDELSDEELLRRKKKKIVMKGGVVPKVAQVAEVKKPVSRKTKVAPVITAARNFDKIKGGNIDYLTADNSEGERRRRKRKDNRNKNKQQEKQQVQANPTKAIKMVVKIEGSITVAELSRRMGIKSTLLIKKMFEMGEMVSINDRIDLDTASFIASEFGYQVENVELTDESFIEVHEDREDELVKRPPVVTVMGHVDHGKTKLLDAIRNTNVVDREAGGITQHIGAYTVSIDGGDITFLDTPGHEAFTAMRSRGAQATDIVILIVAADDGVMPQTVEAINHAKAAKVPIIVAVNKIDKPNANPDKVRQELMKYEIVPEEWGGENLFVEISAKQRINIDGLLETILLQVEMMDLKANPSKSASGIVIESRMDQGKGPVATTLIKDGTLKVGDLVVTGTSSGYVRSMIDWKGSRLKAASLSMAVEITGLDSVPQAGENIYVFSDEKKAKAFIEFRRNKYREEKIEKQKKVTLDNLFEKIEEGETQELNLIVKADVDGSVEAINTSLKKIEHDKIKVRIIHSGVGAITENDIILASASNAIVFGFNVRMDSKARAAMSSEDVDVRIYSIIYDLIESVKSAMTGRLAPVITEQYLGKAEVRQTFNVPKIGVVAGCMVVDGKIVRNGKIKLIRENIVVYQGIFNSLQRFKDSVKEVKNGYECGLGIENCNDIKIGDVIECYIDVETKDEVK